SASSPGRTGGRSNRESTSQSCDIALQLFDRGVLSRDGPVHQVADRDNAHEFFSFQNREMADAVAGHQAHALLHTVSWRGGDNRAGNDFPNFRFAGGLTLESHFAGVIAL